jgi:DNA-binding PadR family transcriptional regulator
MNPNIRMSMSATLVARVLLESPDEQHYGYEICGRTGIRAGVSSPLLRRWTDYGWLTSEMEKAHPMLVTSRPLRRYYRLTELGRENLTEYLETARADRRFEGVFTHPLNYESHYGEGRRTISQRDIERQDS